MGGGLSATLVAVGTSNPMKVRAVRRAFKLFIDAEVVPVKVETGVPDQPVGVRELVRGAALRAIKARKAAGAHYGVGVEAGPLPFPSSTGYIETQVAVIVGPGEKASVGLSPSFEVSPDIVKAMLARVELSKASGIVRGGRDIGEGIGFIGVKTRGHVTRQDLTFYAVVMALVPWLEGGAWLAGVEDLLAQVE